MTDLIAELELQEKELVFDRFFFRARLCAVNAAITWHTHPSRPPDPIHSPGVTISQKIPRRKSPL